MGSLNEDLSEFNKDANEVIDNVNEINKNTNEIKETLACYRDRYQYAEKKGGSFNDKFWNFAEGEKKS